MNSGYSRRIMNWKIREKDYENEGNKSSIMDLNMKKVHLRM